jgi:hypothetical protein
VAIFDHTLDGTVGKAYDNTPIEQSVEQGVDTTDVIEQQKCHCPKSWARQEELFQQNAEIVQDRFRLTRRTS